MNPFANENEFIFISVYKTIKISFPNIASFCSLWLLNLANSKITELFNNEDYISAYAMSYMWSI